MEGILISIVDQNGELRQFATVDAFMVWLRNAGHIWDERVSNEPEDHEAFAREYQGEGD